MTPARRGLTVFFAIVVAGSAACELLLIRAGDSIRNHVALVLTLMWMPALASVIARLVNREGFRDVSFRFGGAASWRMTLLAWLFPLAVGSLAYAVAWVSGLEGFAPRAIEGLPAPAAPLVAFLLLVAVRLVIGVPIAAIAAAGEEIGWRGYMLTRLIEAGVPRPVFVSGVIWAAWHLPLVMAGVYTAGRYPLVAAASFTVMIVSLGFVLAHVRLASGSVWPAVVGHSSWNATIQGVFDYSTTATASLWVGESGVLVAVATVVSAYVAIRLVRKSPTG